MAKYRKKPVVIDALQWMGHNTDEIKAFVGFRDNGECRFMITEEISGYYDKPAVVHDDLHSTWVGTDLSDWIILGIQGEFYPCKSDVFQDTYEVA